MPRRSPELPPPPLKQTLGQRGEALALCHLQAQGFSLKARNYRHGRGEIDLIVTREHLLVFVEVKLRSGTGFGWPESHVSPQQQARIRTTAEAYLLAHPWPHAIRFDIIALLQQGRRLSLRHFEDAFY